MRKETLLKGGIGAAATMLAVTGVVGTAERLDGAFNAGPDEEGERKSQAQASEPRQLSPPGGKEAPPSGDDLLAQLYGHDRHLAEMAQDIPGLAGMFIGSDGATLQVSVVDPASTRVEDVKGSIARVFPEDPRIRLRDVQLRQAEYSFLELAGWYVPLRQRVLGHSGTVYTDIHERRNRLEIGVLNAEAQAWVKEQAKVLSIPEAAVLVEIRPPIQHISSLQDHHRPLVGGLQIERGAGGRCTYGLFARRVTNGRNGFITASHCTNIRGGVEDTNSYQPVNGEPKFKVGNEVLDPPLFSNTFGGCPGTPWSCRFSDAAWSNSVTGQDPAPGELALSAWDNPSWSGSTREIISTAVSTENDLVEKVGKTTGRTSGHVTAVCVDIDMGSKVQLCSTEADYFAAGGDSGAAVYWPDFWPGVGTQVILVGIHYAGGGGFGYFSPWSSVEAELEDFTVCVDQSVC